MNNILNMKIENLDQGIIETDPIRVPITICFKKEDEQRWCSLRARLKSLGKNYKISSFARNVLLSMMDDLEKLVSEKEKEKGISFRK